jgi:hypothetical protein
MSREEVAIGGNVMPQSRAGSMLKSLATGTLSQLHVFGFGLPQSFNSNGAGSRRFIERQ